MQKNSHKQIVYHANCAILAYNAARADELDKHCAVLSELTNDSTLHKAYYLYVRALSARRSRNRDEYNQLLSQAYELFLEADERQGAGVVLLELWLANRVSPSFLATAKNAFGLFKNLGDEIGMGKSLTNIGTHQADCQDFENSCNSFRKALSIQIRTGDAFGTGGSLTNLATCYFDMGDQANALLYSQQSVDCLEDIQRSPQKQYDFQWQTTGWVKVPARCEPLLANAYINHGNALKSLGENETAIEQYGKALALMREAGNKEGEAIVLNQIGETLRVKGEFSHAEEFFRQGRELFEGAGTRGYMYAVSLQSVGEACAAQGRFEEALEQYEASLAEFRSVSNKAGEAEVLILLGELLTARRSYSEAVDYLNQGLELAQSISITDNIVRGNRALGSALMHIDSARAREYFGRALLIAEEMGMKFEQQNIHRDLFRYYKFIGDSTQALSHHERHHALKESLFSEEADLRLKNLQILYGVERYKQSLAESEDKIRLLEIELGARTYELSGVASRIVEKQEFIEMTERGLNRILAAHPDEKDERALELLRLIRADHSVSRDWEEFTRQFMSIHREYAERLMELAPNVSPTELKVCVLLRLSMNTKQIADVLKVSSRSIENHRLRIRRKLGLGDGENLFTYLLSLDVSNRELRELPERTAKENE